MSIRKKIDGYCQIHGCIFPSQMQILILDPMTNFNSDSQFDGEWEDRGGLIWNEFDWRKYLKDSEKEIARFLSIYNDIKDQPGHLDETAQLMGWEVDDWSNHMEEDLLEELEDLSDIPECDPTQDFEDLEPYTLHKHPVFIVTRALHLYMRHSWEQYMQQSQSKVSPGVAWDFGKSLHQSEIYATLALQSLDLGDFALTTCHLKTAIYALNQSLATLQNLEHPNAHFLDIFQQEMYIRIFDLREVWLRVMEDCRAEVKRRKKGS